MKSPFALPAAAAILALLSACGQPGPLYMPKPPVRAAAGAPAATPAPAPVTTASPPAPAAGMTVPSAGSNVNDTQTLPSSSPATQQ